MTRPRWNLPQAPNPSRTDHGLIAWLHETRVVLPLKGVECRFEVTGCLVEVWVDQIYHQDNREALNCQYQFPLPADASVFACEININGRVIRAKVEEREAARQLAEEKKAAGHRTGLVEMERDNLFTLELGNVQPDDLVVVRLGYFQALLHLGAKHTVEIPFCPGIRYIPGEPLLRSNSGKGVADDTDQVPDASRISPPRMNRLHPDAAYLNLQGRLDRTSTRPDSISSPTHPIGVRENGCTLDICLSDGGALPDRDFVVRWDEAPVDTLKTQAWTHRSGDHTFALLELKAPQQDAEKRGPMDFYFLVDRSGSMDGIKWTKAVQALQTVVAGLKEEDRVMVTLFESGFRDFAEEPLPRDRVLNDPAFAAMEQLGVAGGTEVLPPLEHLVDKWQTHSGTRNASLILITDAQVGNEPAVLQVAARARQLRIHCFGIDHMLNDGVLKKLASQNGGTFHSLKPGDDIVGAVCGLVGTVGEPVLKSLDVGDEWEPVLEQLPDVHPGQTVYIPLRARVADAELCVRASERGGESIGIDRVQTVDGGRAVRSLWSKQQIERLIEQGETARAVALSKEANLVCPLTAFVAWDEEEKVAVANQELVQPVVELLESRMLFCEMGPSSVEPDIPKLFNAGSTLEARDALSVGPDDFLGQDPEDDLTEILYRFEKLRASEPEALRKWLERLRQCESLEPKVPAELVERLTKLILEYSPRLESLEVRLSNLHVELIADSGALVGNAERVRKIMIEAVDSWDADLQASDRIASALAESDQTRQSIVETLDRVRKVRAESKRLYHEFEQDLEKLLVGSDTEQARES